MKEAAIGFGIIANISALAIAIFWHLEKRGKVKIPLLYKHPFDVNGFLGCIIIVSEWYALLCFSIVGTELLYGLWFLCKLLGSLFV